MSKKAYEANTKALDRLARLEKDRQRDIEREKREKYVEENWDALMEEERIRLEKMYEFEVRFYPNDPEQGIREIPFKYLPFLQELYNQADMKVLFDEIDSREIPLEKTLVVKQEIKRSLCAEFCHQCFAKDDDEANKDKWDPNPKYKEYTAWIQKLIDAENELLAPREVSLKFRPPIANQEGSRDPSIRTKKGELQIILEFKNPLNPKK